jgi:hypothetical protein
MKIITVSNYDKESFAQRVVADNIKYKEDADIMVHALQNDPKRVDSVWYRIVKDDYQLWLGMEEFADNTCELCGCDLYGLVCCLAGH